MTEKIKRENESADDLGGGLFVYQPLRGFRFGIDAVLLSHFPRPRKRENVLDLCTGSGVIPILMSRLAEDARYAGLEIDPEAAKRAERSVRDNGLAERITIYTGDAKEASRLLARDSFTLVTCNPPYMPAGSGIVDPSDPAAAARHELSVTAEDIIREAAKLLKNTGRLCMVHRPFRLAELLGTMQSYGLAPKRLRMVHPHAGGDANLILIEAVKGGKAYMTVEPPLIVYDAAGQYTEEIRSIYGGEENV